MPGFLGRAFVSVYDVDWPQIGRTRLVRRLAEQVCVAAEITRKQVPYRSRVVVMLACPRIDWIIFAG